MNQPIRIIAWGNAGRRDDGAALALLERLERRVSLAHLDVRFHAYHQLGPEVAGEVTDASLVLFVDAHIEGDKPPVYCECVAVTERETLDSHHCSPATLLGLCESMGWNTPPCYLIGIHACDCSFGDTLSPQTDRFVNRAVAVAESVLLRQASAEHAFA